MKKTLLQTIYNNYGASPQTLLLLMNNKLGRTVALFEMFNVLSELQLERLITRTDSREQGTQYWHWYHAEQIKRYGEVRH